jgi:DNA-binding NarL/FixJ family response regulator
LEIKIAIVEDNDGIRESLDILISGSPGFICIAVFKNSEEAIQKIPSSEVDVVLMDINLPNMSGIECTKILKEINPKLQIIMQTVYEDSEMIFESLKAGASGYLLKRTPPAKLLEAIEEVYKGGSPMSSQIARMVVESFQVKLKGENNLPLLTGREEEIILHLSKGYRYKEIAEKLFISIDTVRSHIRNIYEKLQVRSRTEAVLKYYKK